MSGEYCSPSCKAACPGRLLIRELDLPSDKAIMLQEFAEKAIECLDKAYP
ncbi:MAG: hypothetical protein LM590_06705 [Thermofilum sp.]|nr:hypothetical protein [Thermofilum sp.]